MDTLLLDVAQRKQPAVLASIMRQLPIWIKFIVPLGLAGGVVSLIVMFGTSRAVNISGRVISANTKMPIGDVMVAVESGLSHEETGLGSYITSDSDGKFVAKARGKILVSAWKPGYALRSLSAGDASTAKDKEIVIELRELTATDWVPEHDAFYKFNGNRGFSFLLGETVTANDVGADIVVAQNENEPGTAIIETQGAGGILFQPFDDRIDFYNTPEAPLTGYQKRLYIDRETMGLYFVRTRDGKHYAKFRLLVDLVHPPDGSAFLDLDSARLLWAYQPDGTRNLEIRPGKDLPFPLGKFGIKRE